MAVLRSVAKTDTFETQRQKINLIAQDLFSIASGGTDLSAGILKLGDGAKSAPSLAFLSNESLGLYRLNSENLRFVSQSRQILDVGTSGLLTYTDFTLQDRRLETEGILVSDYGQNYDPGTYDGVVLYGGSGVGGTADITVTSFTATLSIGNADYTPGSFNSVPLIGGTGVDSTVDFNVYDIEGEITNPGSGYADGVYNDVPVSGGSGTGAVASVSITNGEVVAFTLTSSGSGYQLNDDLNIADGDVGSGGGGGFVFTITSDVGRIYNVNLNQGTGYSVNDILTLPQSVNNVSVTLDDLINQIVVPDASNIYTGYKVVKVSGTGELDTDTTVTSVDYDTNTVGIDKLPTAAGSTVVNFNAPWGDGTGFQYVVDKLGVISNFAIADVGSGYDVGDKLSINEEDLTTPLEIDVTAVSISDLTFTTNPPAGTFTSGDIIEYSAGALTVQRSVIAVVESGGFTTNLWIEQDLDIANTTQINITGDATQYEVDANTSKNKFYINGTLTGSATLYARNKYNFNLSDSSLTGHQFLLSETPDGPNTYYEDTVVLSISDRQISFDTTNIIVGMQVSVQSGTGSVPDGTFVQSIDSPTTLTLSEFPDSDGSVTLRIAGSEYTNGVVKSSTNLQLTVSEATPSTLYYYCGTTGHVEMGYGTNGYAILTIDQNNPKVFGSGFDATVLYVDAVNTVVLDVSTGSLTSVSLDTEDIAADDVNVSNKITTKDIQTTTGKVQTNELYSIDKLSLNANNFEITANLNFLVGNTQTLSILASGDLNTPGYLKTTSLLNINDTILHYNDVIESQSGYDINLSPAQGRLVKIIGDSAIVIPSGTSSARPGSATDGAIRFNTDTNQYEGYSSTTSSWTSLGGVRDLDGNTYIKAEETVGSNDNTLWFVNNDNVTLTLSPTSLDFQSVKKINSRNISLPEYVDWTSNTPVTLGQYLKYKNNVYEVTLAGTTGTSGNEPVHTTGAELNGTAELTYYDTAVANLLFSEINEVQIGTLLDPTPMVIGGSIRLSGSTISTNADDLIISPFSGKKVVVNTNTSFAIPVGGTGDRGNPGAGSIRYNTDISQFEGYNGAQWSSLGGVRDVDGNTYIIPELSAGSNENILYFYNDSSNTLRVTTNGIELDTIDTITSTGSNLLNVNASLVTFDSLSTSIDNTGTETFISSTKDALDLGLSTGLTNEPIIRLDIEGDVYLNTGFGTGTYEGVKIFDGDLKEFELADYKISTSQYPLLKGTTNAAAAVVYNPLYENGAKVQVMAKNDTTGDKEIVEFTVIDKGTDIFYSDYGNVLSGANLINAQFDFNAGNEVRITVTLTDEVTSGDVVNITIVSNIIKI